MGNITAKNYVLTEEEKSLIGLKKVRIMSCLPRQAKKSASIAVNIEQVPKGAKKIAAEIIVNVPGKKDLVARSSGHDLTSAFETAENKIKSQIRRYKDDRRINRGLLRKLFRRR